MADKIILSDGSVLNPRIKGRDTSNTVSIYNTGNTSGTTPTPLSKYIQDFLDVYYTDIDAKVTPNAAIVSYTAPDGTRKQLNLMPLLLGKDIKNAGDVATAVMDTDIDRALNDAAGYIRFGNQLIKRSDTANNTGSTGGTGNTGKVDTSTASSAISNLSKSTSGVGTKAKSNRTITSDEYKMIKTALPDYTDAEVLNLVDSAPWLADLITSGTTSFSDTKSTDDLNTYLKYAYDQGAAARSSENATLREQADNALSDIVRDTTLLEAIQAQRLKDVAEGVSAGSRATNIQKTISEAAEDYKTIADDLRKNLIDIPKTVRESTYTPLAEQLENYTAQQVSEALRQEDIRKNNIDNAGTIINLLRGAIESEINDIQTTANENETSSDNATESLKTKASAESNADITAQDADLTTLLNTLDPILNYSANSNDTVSNVVSDFTSTAQSVKDSIKNNTKSKTSDTGTIVSPKYVDVNSGKVDTSIYKTLFEDPAAVSAINTLLNKDTYTSATDQSTIEDLAGQYGLGFLKTQKDTTKQYDNFAKTANKESNRTFNQAQLAYLSALAAGDKKTIDQLTQLATTAGVNKRGLYDAAALAQNYKQQQTNANTGNTLAADYQRQIADNNMLKANAKTQAQKLYSTQTGVSSTQDTLGNVQTAHNANSNTALNNYAGLALTGVQGQSNFNNIVSNANQNTNLNLNSFANSLTENNNTAATNNTQNKATVKSTKNQLKNTKDWLERIANGEAV